MNVIIIFCAAILIYVASIVALYRVWKRHERKHLVEHVLMLIGTAFGAWWIAHILKIWIHFPRPDLTKALFLPHDINSYGFPSGHAAFMFALATTMYFFDKKAGRVLYVLAIVTGIARVLAGVHFWYDIIGGAVLGYMVSLIVVHVCKPRDRN
jgi:membrane-associated phospholipid phosphatase